MNYPDSVRFLYALGNELKTAKFGLERAQRIAAALGNVHVPPPRFIHVAGTNGKGSTCAFIESALRAAGFSTGLFTSPHLLEPTERIRLNGQPVLKQEFTAAFDHVHQLSETLIGQGAIDAHPSYFETVTAMALLIFRERKVDFAIMEVGLGGRLDATNIIRPELCVITPVDFDHESILGNSIEAIAFEKAGILKPEAPAIIAQQRPEAMRVIRDRADAVGAPLIEAWRAEQIEARQRGNRIQTHHFTLECALPGRHQGGNVLTAVTALAQLDIPSGAIERGIAAARWPGRLQHLSDHPEIVVDGAHNPAGARSLAAYVAEFYSNPKPTLIFGAMRDKAIEEITSILFPHFDRIILTAPHQPRAISPEGVQQLIDRPTETAVDLAAALALALARSAGTPIFITGSLFLVGEALLLQCSAS